MVRGEPGTDDCKGAGVGDGAPAEAAQKKREYLEHPERRKATNSKWARKPEVLAARVVKRKESAELRAREKQLREHYRDTLADCLGGAYWHSEPG